jgi:hypothetical protein
MKIISVPNRLRWLSGSVVVVGLVVGCGGDSTGPKPTSGLSIEAGADVIDSIGTVLTQALIIEVRDSAGKAVHGAVVRFSALPNDSLPYQIPLAVANLSSQNFSSFASDSTDTHGRTGVLVELGGIAGRQGVVITVPARGLVDTAWYTVKPGHAARFTLRVNDTVVTRGKVWDIGARVMDRVGNTLPSDSVTYTPTNAGETVTASGGVTAVSEGRSGIVVQWGTAVDTSFASIVPPGKMVGVRPGTGVYVMNLDGTAVNKITSIVDYSVFPQWSPDGTRVTIYEGDAYSAAQLTAISLDGVRTPLIQTPTSTLLGAAWARPDMSGLVYFAGPQTGGGMSIWRMNANGSGLVELFSPTNGSDFTHPAPSPDGKTVVYDFDPQGIMALDVATKTVHALGLQGFFPVYSPDGTHIAYLSASGLMLANSDGTNSHTLSATAGNDAITAPSWSADGKWILAPQPGSAPALVRASDGAVLPLPFAGTYIQFAQH